VLVLGAPNSSNSNRLVDVAKDEGVANAHLIQRASEIDWAWLEGGGTLGLTAGASAPELLVEEVIAACRERFEVSVEEVVTAVEDIEFKLPRALVA
jgi:4-hydroxy-3-methylbut-2-enyl diphosphate reductase